MNNIFIFYIPGSMGSLLSVLIQSQMNKHFIFNGFNDNTAHQYIQKPYQQTHRYYDYLDFKKNNISLEEHLFQNKTSFNNPQTLDINWCEAFEGKTQYKSIICYVDDYNTKLNNYYFKCKNAHYKNPKRHHYNFHIKDSHKDDETIDFIKTLLWWVKQETKFLKSFPRIEILSIIKEKKYEQLEIVCPVSNKKLLDIIVDEYNKKQTNNWNFEPTFQVIIDKLKQSNKLNSIK